LNAKSRVQAAEQGKEGAAAAIPISLGGPPLPSAPLGHRYGNIAAPVRIDVYLDFTCPFSKKMFLTLHDKLLPYLKEHHPNRVLITEFNQIQPWHPASSLLHEAALSAEKLGGIEAYSKYSMALFQNQAKFMDDALYDKSRKQIYEELAQLAGTVGIDRTSMISLLTVKELDKPYEERKEHNGGNEMTGLLKLYIKQSRKAGLHVSPTVYVNGIEDGGVSSGFTLEQWLEHLKPLLE